MLGKDEPEHGKTEMDKIAPDAVEFKLFNKATMDRGDLVAFLFIMGVVSGRVRLVTLECCGRKDVFRCG